MFYHLRNIATVRSFILAPDLEKLIHRLQLIQNAAVRLLTWSKNVDHITPVLASLHWLPVYFRIDIKMIFVLKGTIGKNNTFLFISGPFWPVMK